VQVTSSTSSASPRLFSGVRGAFRSIIIILWRRAREESGTTGEPAKDDIEMTNDRTIFPTQDEQPTQPSNYLSRRHNHHRCLFTPTYPSLYFQHLSEISKSRSVLVEEREREAIEVIEGEQYSLVRFDPAAHEPVTCMIRVITWCARVLAGIVPVCNVGGETLNANRTVVLRPSPDVQSQQVQGQKRRQKLKSRQQTSFKLLSFHCLCG
jgi:hypothetical protein